MQALFCQSCGMPLEDKTLWGSEIDGEKTAEYCCYCYEGGAFKQPNLTLEEMVAVCVPFMEQKGMPVAEAKALLEQHLPHLKRWRKE